MRKYNYIYEKIIDKDNDSDIIGMLAYSIYKKQKIEYIERFKIENNRDITEDELEVYHQIVSSETQINYYKEEATRISAEFSDRVFLKYFLKYKDELKQTITSQVIPNLIASFIWILGTSLIIVAIKISNIGWDNTLEVILRGLGLIK